jgi:hypothetical protein
LAFALVAPARIIRWEMEATSILTRGGIEVMHMIRKGQLGDIKDRSSSAANQFYSLAF